MGEVYRARDTRLLRDVALKILPEAVASDPGQGSALREEARAASALNHPNIVTVYEVGQEGPISYIAMELVEGRTLRESTFAGPLPDRRLLEVACQIASGLARAHEAGIVHRDLKTENVMISRDGLVKILDFGLAKRIPFEGDAGSVEATQTQEGAVVGTVGYMSPEQAAGKSVDYHSDQFSFGSILYEMLTGKRAFERPTAAQTLSAIMESVPQPIAALNSKAPSQLRWIVERCLAKEPRDRYAATEDLERGLTTLREHFSDLSGEARPPLEAPRRRARCGSDRSAAALLAAMAGIYLLGRRVEDRRHPRRASGS